MSANGIGALERGDRRSPQRETLALLARALGLDGERRRAFEAAAGRRAGTPARGTAVPEDGDNLPLSLTSFVGREVELTEIAELVKTHRLVTLTGTGGVGKTRTALRVAVAQRDSSHELVSFVELGPVVDPSLVTAAVAKALGIAESPNRSLLDTVVTALRAKRLLVVLDNCEHVITEAAVVANALLRGCPELRILATSREALRVGGEHTYRLSALDAAIELFAERARAVDYRFALDDENTPAVAEICRRLDGIPLAIELAAARANVLSPAVLSKRLEERFSLLVGADRAALPRQKTLRALIDWSYDLLSDRERLLLCRLSAFPGTWSLDAASTICSDEANDPSDSFDVLSALLEKSLVDVEVGGDGLRYRLLESTRAYARDHLPTIESPERVAREHARYYAGFVRTSRRFWEALDDQTWQRSIVLELDNIRAALEWALRAGNDCGLGVRILSDLVAPELVFEQKELGNWYAAGNAAASEIDDRSLGAMFRRRYALTQTVSHISTALRMEMCTSLVAEARELGDPVGIAEALKLLGQCHQDASRFAEADTAFEEACQGIERQTHPALWTALKLTWGFNDIKRGELDAARRKLGDAKALARPGSAVHANIALNLGELEFAAGRVELACGFARSAIDGYRDIGLTLYCGVALFNLAAYEMELERPKEAREALREGLETLSEADAPYYRTMMLESFGVFATLFEDGEVGARLLGYSEAQDRRSGRIRDTTEARGVGRAIGKLRDRLDSSELERLLSEGSALTEAQALAYAERVCLIRAAAL